jgi:hypothetical protein
VDEIPQSTTAAPRSRAWVAGLVLFAVTLCANTSFLSTARIDTFEEHFWLAQHLRITGVLSINDRPALFRPPGFPIFAAGVLWTCDRLGLAIPDERAVVLANGLLLSVGAVLLFSYLVRTRPAAEAAAFGCLFAFHPAVLIIATNTSYPPLHMVLMVAATLALATALSAVRRPTAWALAAGLAWGAATLVRPLSLILPPFVLLLARWEFGAGSWRRALRFTSVFTLGMALIIAPYTWRNYRASGRLIAVSAQAGFSFWALSVERTPSEAGYPDWGRLWKVYGMPIYTRVTGAEKFRIEAFYDHVLPLNDAFAHEARLNIAARPGIYASNVLRSFAKFNTDGLAWWIDRYRAAAHREGPGRGLGAGIALAFSVGLTGLALAGLVRGICRGETLARTILVLYAMLCLATSINFSAARYNYARLPLIILAVPLLLKAGRRVAVRFPGSGEPGGARPLPSFTLGVGTLFAAGVAALAAAASLLVL